VQRKVFRIEQMMAERRGQPARRAQPAPAHNGHAAHDDDAHFRRGIAALIHEGDQHRLTAAAGELGAAIESMEKATQGLLKITERADGHARRLAALLNGHEEQACVQAIQNDLAELYEACNFQDLAGQRISKVIETLALIEHHLSALLSRDELPLKNSKADAHLINGPRLDGANGHVTQQDIDLMFD
jgi:chemotaxis protein CheZ